VEVRILDFTDTGIEKKGNRNVQHGGQCITTPVEDEKEDGTV